MNTTTLKPRIPSPHRGEGQGEGGFTQHHLFPFTPTISLAQGHVPSRLQEYPTCIHGTKWKLVTTPLKSFGP